MFGLLLALLALLALLCLFSVGYLLTLLAAALRRRMPLPPSDKSPRIAVVIPAHDEELVLAQTLQSLRAQDYPAERFEIVVVADNGIVLIGSQDDRLYAIAADGRLAWSVLLDGDVDGTPAIGADGSIYIGADDRALHILGN